MTAQQSPKRFSLVLIKPSHYDDDGYVIQWLRSSIPSNTLAVLNGLALDCQERRVLGNDVDLDISSFDEANTRIRPERIARQIARNGGRGMAAWWECNRTSIRGRWISHGASARPACRSASAVFTSPVALPCCRICRLS
jgi:hypothetical protein